MSVTVCMCMLYVNVYVFVNILESSLMCLYMFIRIIWHQIHTYIHTYNTYTYVHILSVCFDIYDKDNSKFLDKEEIKAMSNAITKMVYMKGR